jgi:pyruvate dehydrogenase E2 component (dihydrolipoamide acetyltransferase)
MRARSGGLRSSELSDPTITVTNIGERGVETVFGIIYPPQVALVGFGKPIDRPGVVDGMITPRRMIIATLSADHRASDGHRGALFLSEVDRLLQDPDSL